MNNLMFFQLQQSILHSINYVKKFPFRKFTVFFYFIVQSIFEGFWYEFVKHFYIDGELIRDDVVLLELDWLRKLVPKWLDLKVSLS